MSNPMKLMFCSEYNEFSMFLTEFKIGAEAVVFDKEAEGSLLCKVVNITEDENAQGKGDYEAEFVIPDGNFMVGVDVTRPEKYPNEFYPAIKEYEENPRALYC